MQRPARRPLRRRPGRDARRLARREPARRRPFVVADKVNAARLDILGLKDAALFGEVKPEPDLPNLEAAVAAAKAADADAVIGFGGGSAMDLAKLVAVLVDERRSGLPDISGPNRAPDARASRWRRSRRPPAPAARSGPGR